MNCVKRKSKVTNQLRALLRGSPGSDSIARGSFQLFVWLSAVPTFFKVQHGPVQYLCFLGRSKPICFKLKELALKCFKPSLELGSPSLLEKNFDCWCSPRTLDAVASGGEYLSLRVSFLPRQYPTMDCFRIQNRWSLQPYGSRREV